jgi:hypothetical protein
MGKGLSSSAGVSPENLTFDSGVTPFDSAILKNRLKVGIYSTFKKYAPKFW